MADPMEADDVVIAEAAAWIARLQGPERTPAAEAAFREWLAADQAHERAFSRATDVWDVIPGAARFEAHSGSRRLPEPRTEMLQPASPARAANVLAMRLRTPFGLGACAALVAMIVAGVVLLLLAPTFTTAPGEQRTITLHDGTRVSLNTDSKVLVAYTQAARRVHLDRGEAIFEVAKDPHRPFIVEVGGEQVRALGTVFVVRKQGSALAVTLIEGRVEITKSHDGGAGMDDSNGLKPSPVALSPGERLTLRADAPAALDRPKIEAVTAWRRGEVMFDDTSLREAASEFDRYGSTHVVVASPELAELRISGVFQTRDPEEFVDAIARLHNLRVDRQGSQITLSK
jgi:transmembrane sensor